MIYLTKGQPLLDNPNLVVYDPTGYYNDGDSVICASIGLPEEPVCRYEAKYVLYGGMVYSISNPDDLMTEIIKIDPASLFGKDSQQVAVDKMVEKIVPQEPGEVVEEATTEEVDPTDTLTEEEIINDPLIETEDSEITDPTSTTTPDAIIPEVITPLETTSTTSPTNVIEATQTATTDPVTIDSVVGTSTDTTSNL
ncbi:MAG: hypothetical protein K8Q91_02245 [Candidatus Vogelbacteria bacterium]|nr:hypothetical protein [Candidatus Vogelbacteria bacterium]